MASSSVAKGKGRAVDTEGDTEMTDIGDNTDKGNPNLEQGLSLSKKQRKMMREKENGGEGLWTPGNTIRLMHKAIHVHVNLNAGNYYDIGRIGPTVEAPKEKEVGEANSTIPVGLCDDAVQPRHSTNRFGIQSWKSRSGNVARLRLTHSIGKYSIIDSTGSLVEQTNVVYYPEYNSKEKRNAKALDMWSLYDNTRKDNERQYGRQMKDWRKMRRQWEISLVEHEFLYSQNYRLFVQAYRQAPFTQLSPWQRKTIGVRNLGTSSPVIPGNR